MQMSDRMRRWCALCGLGVLSGLLVACAPLPMVDNTAAEAAAPARNACELAQQSGAPRSRFCAPAPGKAAAASQAASGAAPRRAAETVAPAPDSAMARDAAAEPARERDEQGLASWYGPRFHGRRTASGEIYNRRDFTAAHRTLPFGTRVCVRSQLTGRAVVVRINDRGPFAMNRVIDVSQAAAQELGMQGLGIKPVELWLLDESEDDCPQTVSVSGP